MKTLRRILSIVAMFLLLAGSIAVAYAHHDDAPQAPKGEEPQAP